MSAAAPSSRLRSRSSRTNDRARGSAPPGCRRERVPRDRRALQARRFRRRRARSRLAAGLIALLPACPAAVYGRTRPIERAAGPSGAPLGARPPASRSAVVEIGVWRPGWPRPRARRAAPAPGAALTRAAARLSHAPQACWNSRSRPLISRRRSDRARPIRRRPRAVRTASRRPSAPSAAWAASISARRRAAASPTAARRSASAASSGRDHRMHAHALRSLLPSGLAVVGRVAERAPFRLSSRCSSFTPRARSRVFSSSRERRRADRRRGQRLGRGPDLGVGPAAPSRSPWRAAPRPCSSRGARCRPAPRHRGSAARGRRDPLFMLRVRGHGFEFGRCSGESGRRDARSCSA